MDIFDIIGPVMVGPSSSHTAGAARIGRIARSILKSDPVKARIGFNTPFYCTYRGHGSDKAIIGGLLGYAPDDVRIRDSLETARAQELAYEFYAIDIPDAQPLTVLVEAEAADGRRINLQAASVGGGNVTIQKLDGIEVDIDGTYDTLIIPHQDSPGVVAIVTSLLSFERVNIAGMRVYRTGRGGDAIMVIETDGDLPANIDMSLETMPHIIKAIFIEKIKA